MEDQLMQYYITHSLVCETAAVHAKRRVKWVWDVLRSKGVPLTVRAERLLKRLRHKPDRRINYALRLFHEEEGKVDLSSCKLEALPYSDSCMDLVICINVLDHVNDCDVCMEQMYRVLQRGGYLILGQDLTNDEDLEHYPESRIDIGHPIKVDHIWVAAAVRQKYKPVFERFLKREEGRNPLAHYATYIGILQKL